MNIELTHDEKSALLEIAGHGCIRGGFEGLAAFNRAVPMLTSRGLISRGPAGFGPSLTQPGREMVAVLRPV